MIIIEIAGYLGVDAEERVTPSGKKVIVLRIAAKVRHQGNDETVWWRVSIWNDRFGKLLPHLKKGSSVIVIGEMSKPEVYLDKEGNTQIALSMNADIVKFSPFGKENEEKKKQRHSGNYEAYAEEGEEAIAKRGGESIGKKRRHAEAVYGDAEEEAEEESLPF